VQGRGGARERRAGCWSQWGKGAAASSLSGGTWGGLDARSRCQGGADGADGMDTANTCQYVGSKVVVMQMCFL